MRRGASGASGHVTAKPSICDWDALCNSGARAVKVMCLTPGDLLGAVKPLGTTAESRVTCSDLHGEVSRGHSTGISGRPERWKGLRLNIGMALLH